MGTHYSGAIDERLALNVYIKLSRATETISGMVNGHLQNHRLTISQFGVLEALHHLGPLQTSELGKKILKSSGNMTLVIDNLEKRDLVRRERGQKDRRCIEIHLTEAGAQLVKDIMPAHVAGITDAMAALNSTEQEQLEALCKKLGRQQL
ncbi:MAG: MarR family transcriptional regulator [Bacteroidota bacterium]